MTNFMFTLDIPYIYRQDPVPGIHKVKNCRMWRHMRTTQEIRENYLAIQEGIFIRGKRRPANLPTCWDDYYISYIKKYGNPGSWKRNKNKKHQYD